MQRQSAPNSPYIIHQQQYIGAIEVVKFFLKQISEHRCNDFCRQLENLWDAVENDAIAEVLNDVSGFDMNFA